MKDALASLMPLLCVSHIESVVISMKTPKYMPGKPVKMLLYGLYSLVSAVVYGYAAYEVIYLRFARESMLHAYLYNALAIVGALVVDKLVQNHMLSEKFTVTRKNRALARFLLFDNLVSFKTVVYLFYTFILIASRVSVMRPELVSETFRGFVLSIEYCLILVVAFDKFIDHLSKDMARIRKISRKFKGVENDEDRSEP